MLQNMFMLIFVKMPKDHEFVELNSQNCLKSFKERFAYWSIMRNDLTET